MMRARSKHWPASRTGQAGDAACGVHAASPRTRCLQQQQEARQRHATPARHSRQPPIHHTHGPSELGNLFEETREGKRGSSRREAEARRARLTRGPRARRTRRARQAQERKGAPHQARSGPRHHGRPGPQRVHTNRVRRVVRGIEQKGGAATHAPHIVVPRVGPAQQHKCICRPPSPCRWRPYPRAHRLELQRASMVAACTASSCAQLGQARTAHQARVASGKRSGSRRPPCPAPRGAPAWTDRPYLAAAKLGGRAPAAREW